LQVRLGLISRRALLSLRLMVCTQWEICSPLRMSTAWKRAVWPGCPSTGGAIVVSGGLECRGGRPGHRLFDPVGAALDTEVVSRSQEVCAQDGKGPRGEPQVRRSTKEAIWKAARGWGVHLDCRWLRGRGCDRPGRLPRSLQRIPVPFNRPLTTFLQADSIVAEPICQPLARYRGESVRYRLLPS
jgi:hypothetical protein